MKIAIASGKGGTGKTTIATNLAVLFSESFKTVLADLDVEEPNTGLFIGGDVVDEHIKYKMIPEWIESKCTLCNKCVDVCNFNAITRILSEILIFPELCHSCYACTELCPTNALSMKELRMGVIKVKRLNNLDLVEARLDVGQEQAVPLISQTKEFVREQYSDREIQFFDSPPGTSCPVIEATKDSDLVILVTEPTPFGLHDLSLAVDTMRELGREFIVVINRFGTGDSGVEEYCEKNNINVVAKIPDSRTIAKLYSEGKLILTDVPEFRAELELIAVFIKDKLKNTAV